MGGRPVMPARPAGQISFLRGLGRHMDPGGGRRTGPLKKKSGRPAWRAGPKWGKIGKNQGIIKWE